MDTGVRSEGPERARGLLQPDAITVMPSGATEILRNRWSRPLTPELRVLTSRFTMGRLWAQANLLRWISMSPVSRIEDPASRAPRPRWW